MVCVEEDRINAWCGARVLRVWGVAGILRCSSFEMLLIDGLD